MADCSSLVTIRCENHAEVITGGLWDFFNSKHAVDFNVECSGRSVWAHRLIVDVFLPPDKLDRGALSDRRGNLDAVLEFMYRGSVSVSQDKLDSLLWVAKKLDFQLLTDAVMSVRSDLPKKRQRSARLETKIIRKVRPPCRKRKGTPVKLERPSSPAGDESANASDLEKGDPPIEDTDDNDDVSVISKCKLENEKSEDPTADAPVRKKYVRKVPTKRLRCLHCDYSTPHQARYDIHQAKHDPSIIIYRCVCDRPFLDAESLKNHRCKMTGPDAEMFRCPHCTYTNKFAHQLKYHVLAMHRPGEKPFKCPQAGCTYATGRKKDVVRHYNTTHLNIRPFLCDSCGRRFPTPSKLQAHNLTHTGENPRCDMCDQAFTNRSSLRRHRLRHVSDERPYVCHVCGRAFNRRSNLNAHLRNVHKTPTACQGPFPNEAAEDPKSWSGGNGEGLESTMLDCVRQDGGL